MLMYVHMDDRIPQIGPLEAGPQLEEEAIGLHLELKQKGSLVNQKSAVKDRVGRVQIHLGPEAVLLLVADCGSTWK